jgi:hypothetical protein
VTLSDDDDSAAAIFSNQSPLKLSSFLLEAGGISGIVVPCAREVDLAMRQTSFQGKT